LHQLHRYRYRHWSASNSSDNSGPSGRHGSGDGSRGSPGGGGSGGRQSLRSQQWQDMKRWNDQGYPRQGAASRDNRDAGSRGGGSGPNRRYDHGPPQYPRGTAAGSTAVTTAEGAAMTADTTKPPPQGRVDQA
jgi:hypothetical protein